MHKPISIKTVPRDACVICNNPGTRLYDNMGDVLFEAPLSWNLDTCKKCNTVWLNPSPASESISKLYTSYYTHSELYNNFLLTDTFEAFPINKKIKYSILSHYNKYPVSIPRKYNLYGLLFGLIPGMRRKVDEGSGGFNYKKGSKILDVGCGNGDYVMEMNYLGFDTCGIEIDAEAASIARNHGLNVQTGELTGASYSENTFDGIHMNNVIEHLPNPEEVVATCYNILKPGGSLVLKTCSSTSLAHLYYKEHYRGLEVPRHLTVYSPEALAALGKRAGFTVTKITTGLNKYIWYSSYKIKHKKKNPAYISESWILSFLLKLSMSLFLLAKPMRGDDIFISFKKNF